jgi:hypothetical protein
MPLINGQKDTREAEAVVPLPPPEEDWRTHTTHKGSNNDVSEHRPLMPDLRLRPLTVPLHFLLSEE